MKMNLFKKSSFVAALAATMIFASCSKDDDNIVGSGEKSVDKAYMSIKVVIPQGQGTRGSGEEAAVNNENDLNSLHVITFDDTKKIIAYKGQPYVIDLDATKPTNDDAFIVSGDTKYALVVANPGAEMTKLLASVKANSITTFDEFNTAIKGINVEELTGKVADSKTNKHFTMINSLGLVDVTTYVKSDENKTSDELIAEAAAARAPIQIERLSSKVTVIRKTDPGFTSPADGSTVAFTGWILDVTNEAFFPYAEKTWNTTGHTAGSYANNFYTQDPNYDLASAGATKKDHSNLFRKLYTDVTSYTTPGATNYLYCAENTMEAELQKYQNATRIVVKATYTPNIAGYTAGSDWFSLGGVMYKDLAAVQAAYALEPAGSTLIAACNLFYTRLKNEATAKTISISATKFEELTPAELNSITIGGELSKTEGCLKWYKGGVCYYSAAIVHDNTLTGVMEQNKYGVVRNNFYAIELAKVTGAGTPWFPNVTIPPTDFTPDPTKPDPKDPDPEDPKPEDDIDDTIGALGVNITIAPWIKWTTDYEF